MSSILRMNVPLQLAKHGYAVFPIKKNAKNPPLVSWTKESTTDEDQIKAWEKQFPGANYGLDCGKSGLVVVDIDLHGSDGFATLEQLRVEKGYELPKTLVFETPSGGQHHVYKGTCKTTAGVIGLGVDTRGDGGYIVIPSSQIDGRLYKVAQRSPIVDAPEWIARACETKSKRDAIRIDSDFQLDTDQAIGNARDFLSDPKRAKPSVEGKGGHDNAFKVACEVKDYGISAPVCLDIMLEDWNDRCEPPWSVLELQTIVHNAYAYGQNSPGVKTPQAVFDAPVESKLEETEEDELAGRLMELARLPIFEYERQRKQVAEELGIGRVAVLDKEVDRFRKRVLNNEDETGTQVLFPEVEPWPEQVTGTDLLNELVAAINKYVVLPNEAAYAVALWILHTYTHGTSRVSPILCISSPEKRCGKTTLLSVIKALVSCPIMTSNITPAALFRSVEKWQPTLLVDEADTFLRDNEELRGILNSGHVRDSAHVIRTVGESHEPRRFNTWAPKVIALIGRPHPTLEDRSLMVLLRRKRQEDGVERLRIDRLEEFEEIARRCLRWANDNMDSLKDADPIVPASLNDRAADNWRCLLSITEAIGGEWPEKARTACLSLSSGHEDNEGAGVLLLTDFQTLFKSIGSRIPSSKVANELGKMEERPWPEWRKGKSITAKQIASLLRPFGIRPKDLRVGEDNFKGYDQIDFKDAFSRYLPEQLSDNVTNQRNQEVTDVSISDNKESCHGKNSPETRINTELSRCHGLNTTMASDEPCNGSETAYPDWLN